MGLGGKTAVTVSVGALTAALGGLSVPAIAGATAGSASALASVIVQPGVLHAAKSAKQPPTTADCEAAFQVACYEPGQIEQAYNLAPLYAKGING